jgi:nucleotide-binding universal stress UspA family protein
MNQRGRIVVGIDGSEAARVALRWGLTEAKLHKATLEVLHAWRRPMIVVPDEYRGDLVEEGRLDEAALGLIDRELAAAGVDSSVTVERKPVGSGTARALVNASRQADLVVVGRHGTGGLAQELIGPKVVQIAHHATCPVAVVPAEWDGQGSGVVVGLDGSTHAQKALGWAAKEAADRGTSLTAVLAWGLFDQFHADENHDFDPTYRSADAMAALEKMLEGFFEKQREAVAGLEIRKVVLNDLPAAALLFAAGGAELLVVGARGLGGFRELLLGSVSHRCLVHATCPTVVVRAAEASA